MVYVMSDIHGDFERYQAMLQAIDFKSSSDHLYIIGDIIDRGKRGVEIARDIMRHRNSMTLIRGNHEQMCLDLLTFHKPGSRETWMINGGGSTKRALIYQTDSFTRKEILQFFLETPDYLDVSCNGTLFHLVHAWPGNNTEDRIWTRPEPSWDSPFVDRTVIVGHTCVYFLGQREKEPLKIGHFPGFIDIDCGCGNPAEFCRLSCLRLDDMAEFYV